MTNGNTAKEAGPAILDRFDQTGAVSVIQFEHGKYLEQNGKKWTYAEWDGIRRKWLPEPKPLDESQMLSVSMKGELVKLFKMMEEIKKEFLKVAPFLERALKG